MAQQAANKSNKGNPASHRMSNKNRQAQRQSSWQRSEDRKVSRVDAQRAAERGNKLGAKADPNFRTPWGEAKLTRRERRAQDPEVQKRRAEFMANEEAKSKARETHEAITKLVKEMDKS